MKRRLVFAGSTTDAIFSQQLALYNMNMGLIEEIQAKFARDEFEFSKHATDQSLLRDISVQEIREAVSRGEIIEDYPQDKYGPSCLILGFTQANRPIHVHCTYTVYPTVKVITVYEPNPAEWVDYRVRR